MSAKVYIVYQQLMKLEPNFTIRHDLTSIGLDNALVFETSSRGSLRGVFDVKYFDYFGGRSRMAEM